VPNIGLASKHGLYIPQASLVKNAVEDAPKHAISNEKFKKIFLGGA